MKKIIISLFVCLCVVSAARADYYSADSMRCEAAESGLRYEMSNVGQPSTIEDHVRVARIYRAMADRGCARNSETYKEYSRASLDVARSLVYVADYTGAEKARYDDMIKRATGF